MEKGEIMVLQTTDSGVHPNKAHKQRKAAHCEQVLRRSTMILLWKPLTRALSANCRSQQKNSILTFKTWNRKRYPSKAATQSPWFLSRPRRSLKLRSYQKSLQKSHLLTTWRTSWMQMMFSQTETETTFKARSLQSTCQENAEQSSEKTSKPYQWPKPNPRTIRKHRLQTSISSATSRSNRWLRWSCQLLCQNNRRMKRCANNSTRYTQ